MPQEDCFVGQDSLTYDKNSHQYLLCGEVLPQSWRSAGFEPIKRKIQETNAMIFVCKHEGSSKEFRKAYQVIKKQLKSESKGWSIDFQKFVTPVEQTPKGQKCQKGQKGGRKTSPIKGKKMTFAEAVRAVIMHRRCSKIKAVAFLSQLPKVKRERELKDLNCFLDSLVNILQVLCNLRDRDLRTKVVLSRAALKQLRQADGSLTETTAPSNRRKSSLGFEGRESIEEDENSVKSWDDLLSFKTKVHFDENNYQSTKKLPNWQMIAMETDSNKNWSRQGRRRPIERDPFKIIERINAGWNLARARQAYDSKHMVRNIERMDNMRNRIHMDMLDEGFRCVENYKIYARTAMPKSIILDLSEKEIEKMSWCNNLEDECTYFIDSDPDIHFPQLEKLKRFSLLDFTKVNFVKAKLCLYVMSLPANEVLAIPIQRGLLFALSSILQLSKSVLRQWLEYRHLPLYDIAP